MPRRNNETLQIEHVYMRQHKAVAIAHRTVDHGVLVHVAATVYSS